MTVYLEYALLDNFTMDFLLLFLAAATLKITFRWWRIALGAATGAVAATLSVYVSGWLCYLAKAACLFCMCVVAVGWGKKLFWHLLLTLLYTFATGGAIVGLFNLLQVQYITADGLFYNMPVPLFVYVAAVVAVSVGCYLGVNAVWQNKKIVPHLKRVTLFLQKEHRLVGFCDSGNTVTCQGLPVCFATQRFDGLAQYFAEAVLHNTIVGVQICTLAGSKVVQAVKAQIEVDGHTTDVFVALPATKTQAQYQLLLPACLCENSEVAS